ncbi:hypothetical protein Droror1_Dr00026207 [Drosera rotundifolia]
MYSFALKLITSSLTCNGIVLFSRMRKLNKVRCFANLYEVKVNHELEFYNMIMITNFLRFTQASSAMKVNQVLSNPNYNFFTSLPSLVSKQEITSTNKPSISMINPVSR